MIQQETRLKVADNTGAQELLVYPCVGWFKTPIWDIGDSICGDSQVGHAHFFGEERVKLYALLLSVW